MLQFSASLLVMGAGAAECQSLAATVANWVWLGGSFCMEISQVGRGAFKARFTWIQISTLPEKFTVWYLQSTSSIGRDFAASVRINDCKVMSHLSHTLYAVCWHELRHITCKTTLAGCVICSFARAPLYMKANLNFHTIFIHCPWYSKRITMSLCLPSSLQD